MKNAALFIVILFFSFNSGIYSQKVKLKDHKVKAHYLKLPARALPDGTNSYQVEVDIDVNRLSQYGHSKESISSAMNLHGFPKTEVGGDVVIKVRLGNVPMDPWKNKESSYKEKSGKIRKEYYSIITYRNNYGYTIVDKAGVILYESHISGSGMTKTYTSKKFSKRSDLTKWKSKSNAYIDTRQKYLNENVSDMSLDLRRKFAFLPDKESVKFKSLKEKKHPEYRDWLKIEKDLDDAFALLTPKSNQQFKEKMQPIMNFWLEREPGYQVKDKNQKQLKYACRLNLARAYFWLEDYDNAFKYAQLVENGNHKEKDGRKWREKVEKLLKKYEQANATTRHFEIQLSEEKQAEIAAYHEAKEEAIASGDITQRPDFERALNVRMESLVKPGIVFNSSGKAIEGFFVYEPRYKDQPDFTRKSSLRFGYTQGDEIKSATLNRNKLDSIKIADQLYEFRDIKIGSGLLSTTARNVPCQVVRDFNKTQILLAHKFANDTENTYVLYHKKNEKHHYVEGTILKGFSKVVADALEDCEELSQRVKSTDYEGKHLDALPDILNEYDNCNTKSE